jgi:hypothetical protein
MRHHPKNLKFIREKKKLLLSKLKSYGILEENEDIINPFTWINKYHNYVMIVVNTTKRPPYNLKIDEKLDSRYSYRLYYLGNRYYENAFYFNLPYEYKFNDRGEIINNV